MFDMNKTKKILRILFDEMLEAAEENDYKKFRDKSNQFDKIRNNFLDLNVDVFEKVRNELVFVFQYRDTGDKDNVENSIRLSRQKKKKAKEAIDNLSLN